MNNICPWFSLLLPIRDGGSDAVDISKQEIGTYGDDQPSVKPLLLWFQKLPQLSLDPLFIAGIRWDHVQVSGGLVFTHSLNIACLQGCGLPCFVLIAFRALTVRPSSKPMLYHISGSVRLIVNRS